MEHSLTSGATTRRRFLLSAGLLGVAGVLAACSQPAPPAAPTAAPAGRPGRCANDRARSRCTNDCASRQANDRAGSCGCTDNGTRRRREADHRASGGACRRAQGCAAQPPAAARAGRHAGQVPRLRPVERLRARRQPPDRPESDPRAAGLLQRLRRQGVHVAGRELRVQPGLQAADDQDCAAGRQLERRPAVQRRRRRLHAQQLQDLGPKVRWGVDVQQAHRRVRRRPTPTPSSIKFKLPAPRFFYLLTYKYDIGLYIVPKHIFDGPGLDHLQPLRPAKGWPVTTGPWKVVAVSPEQKVIDRARRLVGGRVAGLRPCPRSSGWSTCPIHGETQSVQALITSDIDYTAFISQNVKDGRSRATPRSSPTPARSAVRLHGLVAASLYVNTRKSRSTTRTCAGRSATSSTASRSSTWPTARRAASSRPSCRCRSTRPHAVLRRGQGSARQVRHERVRPQAKGDALLTEARLEEGRRRHLDRCQGPDRLKFEILGSPRTVDYRTGRRSAQLKRQRHRREP